MALTSTSIEPRMRGDLGDAIAYCITFLRKMIDNHGRAWPSLAIEQIRAVEEYGVTLFEEAVPPDNVDAFQRVRQHMTRMNLATGERLFSRWDYRRLIEQQLVDIIQPDVCHCGGISDLRKC